MNDLAQAHLLALDKLLNESGWSVYNLGVGEGYSVDEVIRAARKVTGKDIPVKVSERRAGDPATLISGNEKAVKELCWKPKFSDIEGIIETAWRWHKNHPNGYGT